MNQVIETILEHRSIRKFTSEKLQPVQIKTIVKAAQQASTSSYVMAYSIIGITDLKLKEELADVSGQPYVANNGHLFVFCADLNRISQLAPSHQQKNIDETIETSEQFIVTVVDTALAAQNATIAAESLGLGVCYIGSLRNDIAKVNELLNLPNHVIPLFGLAVGYPDENPEKKPRLPFEIVYHENTYTELHQSSLNKFDQEMNKYYQSRSTNTRLDTWSKQMIRKYMKSERLDVSSFIKDKKLNKR